jgi:hypothetical protein
MIFVMRRAFTGGLALGLVLFGTEALAQAPPGQAAAPVTDPALVEVEWHAPANASPSKSSPYEAVDPRAEASVDPRVEATLFEAATRRYQRLIEFMKKLTLREERMFEQEASRYVKLREFTQKLQHEREQELERSFNESVLLYERKQAFTRQLEERRRSASAVNR